MTAVDAWWYHVPTLVHMDGANGGTTFTDANTNTTLTVSGAVTTTTTSPKYGTACGNFPGADADYLSVSPIYATDLYFGSGNFTIEGWFKCTTTSRQYMTMYEKDS